MFAVMTDGTHALLAVQCPARAGSGLETSVCLLACGITAAMDNFGIEFQEGRQLVQHKR